MPKQFGSIRKKRDIPSVSVSESYIPVTGNIDVFESYTTGNQLKNKSLTLLKEDNDDHVFRDTLNNKLMTNKEDTLNNLDTDIKHNSTEKSVSINKTGKNGKKITNNEFNI